MNRLQRTILTAGVAALAWLAMASATPARADDDFWEDRYNAMRKIWGTPYVPLGYYWDRVQGLPPRPAPVAPGVIADRPIYGPYGFGPGHGYGYGGPVFYGRGYSGYGYPSYGYGYGGYGYPGYRVGRGGVSIGIGLGGYGRGYYPGYIFP